MTIVDIIIIIIPVETSTLLYTIFPYYKAFKNKFHKPLIKSDISKQLISLYT